MAGHSGAGRRPEPGIQSKFRSRNWIPDRRFAASGMTLRICRKHHQPAITGRSLQPKEPNLMAAEPQRAETNAAPADRRRGIPARARRPRHRLFLRQSRHRLSADRRGLQPRQAVQRQGADAAGDPAREPRGRAWRTAPMPCPASRNASCCTSTSAPRTPSTTSSICSRDNVPLILAAGRTPITEKGKFGGRNRYIHWGQEMFDQAGMLREA